MKKREYKTVIWIVLLNLVNIFCMISIMVLVFGDKNLTDIEQITNHILFRDRISIAFYASMILSSFLKSEMFKVNKNLSGHESRDV